MTDPSFDHRFRRDLPDALVLLRQSRGVSQKALADRLGLDPSTLSRYEHGSSRPNSGRLADILAALTATWSELDAALARVRKSREDGEPPDPASVLLRTDATREDATLALMAAVREGRAQELVERLIDQSRYVSTLYHRLKTYEPLTDEDAEADGDAKDDEDGHSEDGDSGSNGEEG